MSRSIDSSNHQADESSSEDYPSDDNSEEFKFSLNARLKQVNTTGSFATAGKCSTVPSPGLNVEACGLVDIPLTENTAKTIIDACHQAPFGKGTLQLQENITDHKLMAVQAVKPLSTSQCVRHGSSIQPISDSKTLNGNPGCKGSHVLRRMGWAIPRELR